MNLNELAEKAYNCACGHGFHDKYYGSSHWKMLVITEVGEMVEADRKGLYPNVEKFKQCETWYDKDFMVAFERLIKNTVWDECADIIIRIFDLCGLEGIDLSGYDENEGDILDDEIDEMSVVDIGFQVCMRITSIMPHEVKWCKIIRILRKYAKYHNVDLDWFIEMKMRYNELRPHKNGKLY